ncbi:MAG: hypothetical protein ACTSQJ_09420 [Promethearchaeota archaeon]
MREYKDYIWIFPYIGGIFCIIAVLTPAAYLNIFGMSSNIWMWGLTIGIFSIMWGNFYSEIFGLICGIICSIVIFTCGVLIIKSANKVRLGKKEFNRYQKKWLLLGIYSILAVIVWIIIIDLSFQMYINNLYGSYYYYGSFNFSFWSFFSPGFGVIGVFIGGGLTIVGSVLTKSVHKKKHLSSKLRKRSYDIKDKRISKQTFNFCPICGEKKISMDSKYCSECGYNFNQKIKEDTKDIEGID